MFSKNHPIILFIDRSGFSVFQDTLANIAKFTFTPDIVANLDVVNKEQFVSLITTFIQINKIVPSSLALILSDNIIYEKDIQTLGLEAPLNIDKERTEEIQNFLEDIPFEEVLAKVIKTDKPRIVAVNKDLVITIADVFVNKGSVMEAVIPSFIFGPKANFTLGLNQDNIQIVLGGAEIVKEGNLLTDQQKVVSSQNLEGEQNEKEKKPKNLRQYLLVGIFITLLVILAVVYLNLGVSQTPPRSSIVPTTTPAGGPSLTQTQISVSPTDPKSIKIKIVQSPGSGEIANNLSRQLLGIGFQDIVSEISQDTPAELSSVIFSKTVPADVREKAFLEIKKILTDISILENQDIDLTITILIGKL